MPTPPAAPPCALYLVTRPLTAADAPGIAKAFAEILAATPVASALVRVAPAAAGDAKTIAAPFIQSAARGDCALLLEEPRLAARIGADGAHVLGAGDALDEALAGVKPDRIAGAGGLKTRDEAMTAGEKGADYVMFGEPWGAPMAPDALLERVAWWAEIFETPCVAYAESEDAAEALAWAGADFVAVDGAVWDAESPAEAARRIGRLIGAKADTA